MSSPYLYPKFASLQKEYDSAVQCNRCGFCETVCPTYMASGKETLSPRGRNQAFRQILEGKILNPKMAEEIFSTCLTCHACTNVCFSEVPVAALMASAKNVLAQKEKFSRAQFKLLGFVLSNRKILSLLLWFSFLLKNFGVSSLLKRIGLLKKISPELDAAEELLETVPIRFGANPPLSSISCGGGRGIIYFSGCGIHYLYPQAAQSCLNILRNTSKDILCPNTACCGLIAHSLGDIPTAKKLAGKNIQELKDISEIIVVDDDSCCGFMKSYGELLEGDLPAVAFSKKIKNLSEFLIAYRSEESFSPVIASLFKRSNPTTKLGSPRASALTAEALVMTLRVTYHDPCQMGNAHKAWDAPREILKNIPGVEFVEMEESNWCCGGAGTYCLKHPDLAESILERKLENIKKSGACLVLTQAASCLLHIGYGLRKKGWKNKRVLHLSEFLATLL